MVPVIDELPYRQAIRISSSWSCIVSLAPCCTKRRSFFFLRQKLCKSSALYFERTKSSFSLQTKSSFFWFKESCWTVDFQLQCWPYFKESQREQTIFHIFWHYQRPLIYNAHFTKWMGENLTIFWGNSIFVTLFGYRVTHG